MKTSTLLLLGAGVGALVLLAKARKAGMGDDDMLVPPPGRTITSSGQVLGGLGLETRFIDSYDANPSQYRRQVIHDLIPGIGFDANAGKGKTGARHRTGSFSKLISHMTGAQNEAAAKEKSKLMEEARQKEMEAIAQRKVNETLLAIQKQAEADMLAQQGIVAPPTAALPPATTPEDNKNKWGVVLRVTSKQANAVRRWMAQKGAGTMTRDEAAKEAMQKNAAMKQQPSTGTTSTGTTSTGTTVPDTPSLPPAPSNYDQAKQAYDIMQAEREQASMSQASSDTGYGRTSDDSGYGSTQQVTEEGSPRLPERISQVETPSAQMLPPQQAAPAPTGNSKVGLIVGGGVLAAIAAALAS